MDYEKSIRAAAAALQTAITAGRKGGLHVAWPGRPEDLGAIAISETTKAKPAAAAAAPATKPAGSEKSAT